MIRQGRNYRWSELKKSGLELSKLIDYYHTFNRSEGKSPATVKWYAEVLQKFLDWLKASGKPTTLGDVGEMEVREFILYLKDREFRGKTLSSHTLNNRVRALRAFFSWLTQAEYLEENPLAKMKPPKVAQTMIEPLTSEELDKIFSTMNQNTVYGARNAAMVALLVDTGLRLSEMVTLKEEDVHLEQRYVKVMGKGSKERMVPLGASCQKALMHYYIHFRVEPAHAGVDTFFLSIYGYPISDSSVKSLMVRLAKASGVTRLHAHLFRHTYATRFLQNGGDVFLLKQNLGHSTLTMVEHYRHIASREAAIMSESFSPLDRMDLRELRRHRRGGNGGGYGAIYPNAGSHRPKSHNGGTKMSVPPTLKREPLVARHQRHRASAKERIPQRA